MSRTSKLRQKRKAHVKHATWDATKHKSVSTGSRGPSKTTPTNRKRNRLPYDAQARKELAGKRGGS